MTIGPLAAEAASLDVQHPFAGIPPEDFPRASWGTERVARWYIARGLQVIPVCAPVGEASCTGASLNNHAAEHKRGKLPVRKWGGARGIAPMTDAEVNDAWRRRAHNVALPMGRNGGAYTVALDFDGPEGERTREAAEKVLGALPPTLINSTGRGRHMLFAAPPDAAPDDVASVKGSIASVRLDAALRVLVTATTGEASAFDLRADGGYIVAPGSRHASGAEYAAGGVPIAPLPRSWWDALPRKGERPGPKRAELAPLPGEHEALLRIGSLPAPRSTPARERYAAVLRKALPAALDTIRAHVETPDSPTNDTIRDEGLRVLRLAIGAGDLDAVHEQVLRAALDTGHPPAAVRATMASIRATAERDGAPDLIERARPERRTSAAGRRSTDGAARAEGETAGQGEEYAPPLPSDGRPRIATGPDLARVVAEAVDALGAHAEVYQRRGVGLVRVLSAPDDSHDPGAPIIDPIPRPVLAAMLSAVARWEGRDRKGNPRHVQPPDLVTAAVHANGTFPASVRPLRGIVEAPTLRRDGSLAAEQGYDAASALFVHCPNVSLGMPARPTLADAREAFGRLAELFADFRFAGDTAAQNVARSAVVAAMLSPLAREAVDGPCPAFVFEADGPNAGKTLAASVCGALVTGRVPAVRQHTADDDETAKRIASIAIAGHPVALFDNVRSHVEGGALEAALSAHGAIAARILGRSEDRELPWRTVLFLTMNAASYSADVARRVVHIAMRGRAVDLDASVTFKVPDLARHVLARRSDLLRDAFVILRAHQIAGRPHKGATLPTFEAWSRVVAAAVHWASGHDPVRARPPESANRDANIARAVTLAWCAAYPGEPLTIGALRSRLLATYLPGAAGPAVSTAAGALRDALAELAGAPDVSRVSAGSLGRRVQLHVVGRVYVDPVTGRSVSIEAAGSLHGSARYAATVEAVDPLPDDHPARGVGECGSEGECSKRPLDETHTERVATPGVVAWDA